MIQRLFVVVFGVILGSVAALAQSPLDAVVTIWADDHFFGTGFFVSADGQILTAYHVIRGAHRITVLHQGYPCSHVLVESYLPNRDLALLRVLDWKKPITYLKLVYTLPAGIAGEHLSILGNGASIENQAIQARMMTGGFRSSSEIRDHGERVFNIDSAHLMDVLYLDANVNDGLSGGPVLSNAGVIGVLSGSLSQGGSISWAIPSKYAQLGMMVQVNKRPEEIASWPPFNLMSGGRNDVRSAVAVSSDVANLIDQYFQAVAKSADDAEQIPALATEHLVYVGIMGRIAEQGSQPDDALISRLSSSEQVIERVMKDDIQQRSRAENHALELALKVSDFYNSVPATQQNAEIFERLFKFMKDYKVKMGKDVDPFIESDKLNVNRIADLIAGESGKEITPSLQFRMSVELERLYGNYTSPEYRLMTIKRAQLDEALGREIQLLMTSRLESRGVDWTFSSKHGFSIQFPAGWELVIYPAATSLLSDIGLKTLEDYTAYYSESGGEFEAMLVNKTMTQDPGTLGLVSLKVFNQPGLGTIGPLTEEERTFLQSGFEKQGYRDIGIEREMLNGKWMTVIKATMNDQFGNPWIWYKGMIHGPTEILSLQFSVAASHAASVIPSCRRILETIEYK